ncbi:MAG: carboxypeptidase-like regulatory domain-containing protein [Bacteroidales bacterium]|jgi:hypothetical protein
MKKIASILSIIALGLIFSASVYSEGVTTAPASASSVTGKVVDLNSGETLAGVAVTIEGTDVKVYTDLDGNFTMSDIKPGTYNLILSMISYKNSLIENVELLPNEKEKMEIKLDNK